ncbi:hypothetical protein LTR29_001495 [Friedmanniomyces endolithicus]|uniref:Uncharacterized protein n=1 Tax=Friedmanniomyces endolithicus TaxID=329885 RepID=A0A4U0V2H2_9PEZI|nr:hypothetical protein LTS09_008442 [Friedmanniomyces endolithicus]KAK0313872.1 hypothetical protein LTR01_002129 [Friedmanniomyces endolithicus]KAK0831445.1 hypothetical protein LTR73_002827 [Friedmanniomyces endolithicus]KAK0947212.1 hypothetical protein LTR29_001495 [Friedmanniomyces endolithicus]TKA42422.1 hypothetical protein B0A54_06872 [Friedmanniomyces endolithicus]
MDEHPGFDAINLATFTALLADYPSVIAETLATLDEQRLVTIPAAVRSRDPQHLTKEELALLMDWKLSHGKFRPQLKKLIQQNEGVTVKSTTIEAFRMPLQTDADVGKAISTLSTLRGVGPATASLLLSVKDEARVPFFSDELYRWALWSNEAGGGWKREIKYSEKSYMELFPRVQELRERLKRENGETVSALQVESVAYVLARRSPSGGKEAKSLARSPAKAPAKTPAKLKRKRKVEEKEIVEDAETAEVTGAKRKSKARKPTKTDAPVVSAGSENGKKRKGSGG